MDQAAVAGDRIHQALHAMGGLDIAPRPHGNVAHLVERKVERRQCLRT